MPSLYPHAKGILYALKDKGIDIAIASRSPTADIADAFLEKLGLKSMFVAQVREPTILFCLWIEQVKSRSSSMNRILRICFLRNKRNTIAFELEGRV